MAQKLNQNQKQNKSKSNSSNSSNFPFAAAALSIAVLALAIAAIVFIGFPSDDSNSNRNNSSHDSKFSSPRYELTAGDFTVACEDSYAPFPSCSPPPSCNRLVVDSFASSEEIKSFRRLMSSTLRLTDGGGSGCVSVLDFISGAASKGSKFVSIRELIKWERENQKKNPSENWNSIENPLPYFLKRDLITYKLLVSRIRELISVHFGIKNLYLAKPSFMSQLSAGNSLTGHDEYWHSHIDKLQYGTFQYTALVYLSDFGSDFQGGEFVFLNNANGSHATVKPRPGRLSVFTSGKENSHWVEKVTAGARYALTIAFTCDPQSAVDESIIDNDILLAPEE